MSKQLVHAIFEQNVSIFADKVAVEEAGRKATYHQLNSGANTIGWCLLDEGLQKGDRVGLFLPSSIEYVASVLGIAKSGAVFMPIEIRTPVKRVEYILNYTQPGIIITDERNLEALHGILKENFVFINTILVVRYEQPMINITRYDRRSGKTMPPIFRAYNLLQDISGEDSSYILFTSGSTGYPKAIEGVNKGLSHFIHWQIKEFSIDSTVKVSQLASVAFDVSLRDIFTPLLAGGTLCIPNADDRHQIGKLVRWIGETNVTLIHCVPSVFRLISEEIRLDTSLLRNVEQLKLVFFAGEPLYGKDVNVWRSLAGDSQELVNLYGPSETTLAKLFYRIPIQVFVDNVIIPLGVPIANTTVILLKNDRLCEVGEIGEIHIKTPFRSKGYYNDQSQTDLKFIQSPLNTKETDIIYQTGDLGRYLKDRSIEFIGRQDNQIKINGNRVELFEIEKTLLSYPGIKKAVVTAIKHAGEENVLVGYYVEDSLIEIASLKKYLKEYLPDYMQPTYFIVLDDFPLNLNGKVDRRALPPPELTSNTSYEAPETEMEKNLEKIFVDVLKINRIGRNSSFFDLGGSSLKAIQIISRVFKACNVLIKLPDLFSNPTIAKLATLIQSEQKETYRGISKAKEQEYYNVSHAQKRLWILNQFSEENLAYNILSAFVLEGPVNIKAFSNAFDTLIQRHENLRARFLMLDGEVKQKIVPFKDVDFKLELVDLEFVHNKEEQIREMVKMENELPFNLAAGCLLRAKLIKLKDHHFVLLFTIHHIVCDGWSMQLLMDEAMRLYHAYSHAQPNPLTPLLIQYKDYIAWQQQELNDVKMNEHHQYWMNKFADEIPVLELPLDGVRPKYKSYTGKKHGFYLNESQIKGLAQIGKETGTTLFMNLTAVLNVLLYRYTRQTDIIIGTPVAGRNHEDLEDLIGVFINTVALRTQFEGTDSYVNVLYKVKKTMLDGFAHQDYPFDQLIEHLNVERNLSRSPLFDVMITFGVDVSRSGHLPVLDDLLISEFKSDQLVSKYDLSFGFVESGTSIYAQIEYNVDLFSATFIDNVAKHLLVIVDTVIRDSKVSLGEIDLLTSLDKAIIESNVSQTDVTIPLDATITKLFEEQVTKTPSHIALEYDNTFMTYAELNDWSNKLASIIRTRYLIQPNDLVAVMMDRSDRAIITLIAVLKAGAAFLPVDPSYPADRIAYLLSDSGAKLIITEDVYTDAIPSSFSGSQFVIDIPLTALHHQSSEFATVNSSKDLAYVIYTSGSTGHPKGVEIRHANFLNYIRWANDYYFSNDQSSFGLFTSLSFDLTLTSIFSPLLRGGKIIIGKSPDVSDTLTELFHVNSGVDTLKLTPSHVMLLKHLPIEKTLISKVILGGEMVTHEHLNCLRALQPTIHVYNEYGPTEATVGCMIKKLDSTSAKISIGKPISGVKIILLDDEYQPVPLFIPGEIFIGGQAVSKGYINKPELTLERFIDLPEHAGLFYRTGDLARRLPNGELEFLGRKDRQVKVRGHRIELSEIEYTLARYKSIHSVQVLPVVEQGEVEHLVAYYTGVESDAGDLKKYLTDFLPKHMIPVYYFHLNKFPLTSNGKLDQKELVRIAKTLRQTETTEYVAPRNEMEEKLTSIWQQILGNRRIGVQDNFFEIGGHSLKAVQIISRIYEEMNIKIQLKSIFKSPTIEGLAGEMEAIEWISNNNTPSTDANVVYTQEITI